MIDAEENLRAVEVVVEEAGPPGTLALPVTMDKDRLTAGEVRAEPVGRARQTRNHHPKEVAKLIVRAQIITTGSLIMPAREEREGGST